MKKRPGLAHFFKKDPHSRILTRVLLFLRFPQTPPPTTKSLTNFDQGKIFNQLCRRRRDVFWRKRKPKKDISYPHDVSSLGCFNWWQSIKRDTFYKLCWFLPRSRSLFFYLFKSFCIITLQLDESCLFVNLRLGTLQLAIQCDQIARFLKVLGIKIPSKSTKNCEGRHFLR